jgi:hypothetical protein
MIIHIITHEVILMNIKDHKYFTSLFQVPKSTDHDSTVPDMKGEKVWETVEKKTENNRPEERGK